MSDKRFSAQDLKVGDVVIKKIDRDLPDDKARFAVSVVVGKDSNGFPIFAAEWPLKYS